MSCSIILLIIHESLDIGLHDTIQLLCLTIVLRIKGSWKLLLDPKQKPKWLPKIWGKYQAIVIQNWVR